MTAQTQTRSARRVAASQGVATKENVAAGRIVAALLEGVSQVETARNAFDASRLTQLEIMVKACAGLEPVTEVIWDRTWKDAVKAGLLASGRYQEKSLPPKVSALQVVVMGLTNGIAPREGMTLKAYEDLARQQLAKRGLREVKAQGAKRQDPAAKEAKASQLAFSEACNVVSLHNASLAANLALVMADPDARQELAKLVAEIAEEVKAKDAAEAAPSRRRKAA
jgi:hypothetical protein